MIDGVQVFQDPDFVAPGGAPNAPALPVLDEAGAAKPMAAGKDLPANAALQADGSVILTLAYPVTLKFRDSTGAVKDEPYTVLHMHRFKGKQLREVQNAPREQYAAQMIASATGMTLARADILHDQMDAVDVGAALRVGLFFITPGRRTGP